MLDKGLKLLILSYYIKPKSLSEIVLTDLITNPGRSTCLVDSIFRLSVVTISCYYVYLNKKNLLNLFIIPYLTTIVIRVGRRPVLKMFY